jgi:hypothetical protein
MTDDVRELLERQARWQKSRKALSWSEKVRLAEAIRESILRLREAREPKSSESRAEPAPTRR